MTETLVIFILATVIGIFHNDNKPTKYELKMEDGSQTNIMLQKNSQYACPIYCGIDHVHYAIMYDSANQIKNDSKLVYHISKAGENIFAIYCSDKKIGLYLILCIFPYVFSYKKPDFRRENVRKSDVICSWDTKFYQWTSREKIPKFLKSAAPAFKNNGGKPAAAPER